MKLTCQKQELVEALQSAIKAIPSNPNTPITSAFLLKATAAAEEGGKGELEVRATNNDLYIITRLDAAIEEPGEAAVSAKYFYDYVRNFPGPELALADDADHKTFRLISGGTSCDLLTIAGEFPPPSTSPAKTSFAIPSKLLKKLISESAFAAADENNNAAQPIFAGVLLEIAENTINLVGTNTHRLALASSPLEADSASGQTVVPARVLAEIGRQLDDSDELTTIDLGREKAVFSFGRQVISTSIINGNFPNYRRVIPKELPITVAVSRSLLNQTVGRAKIIADAVGSSTAPVVKFEIADNKITISAVSQSVGRYIETIEGKVEGGDLTIAFNPNYIIDVLRAVSGEEIQLRLAAPLKPGLIIDPSNERFQCVITPIRVKV